VGGSALPTGPSASQRSEDGATIQVSEVPLPNLGRVLVTHDWLVTWAGSERVLAEILRILPGSDLVVGVVSPEMREYNHVTTQARESWLSRLPGARRHYQWLVALEAAAFWTIDTSQYDFVVSSSHAFAKAVRPGRKGRHLSYCYSPPRYLWDLYETYSTRTTWLRRVALRVGRRPLQVLDRATAAGVTHFVAISQFVAQRIERAYGRGAKVVYPPVTLKRPVAPAGASRSGEFLLYLGRLVPYKRVDLLLQAAGKLGVRVVIAGDGPDRIRLERLGGPRAEFVGAVSEARAAELLEDCAAFVFCGEEDFGIAPLEANGHGAPVVAYRGGAILETMFEGVTAELFGEPTVESLVEAIRHATSRSWDDGALRRNAARFSPERFRRELSWVLQAAAEGEPW